MMSLTQLSTLELATVSGGIVEQLPAPTNMTLEQMFTHFLTTVTNDEMKRFFANNVHVHVNVEVVYYPQLDNCDVML